MTTARLACLYAALVAAGAIAGAAVAALHALADTRRRQT